jgi:hypothetical protein
MRVTMTTITTFIRRYPTSAYFGLTFAISWGGVEKVNERLP